MGELSIRRNRALDTPRYQAIVKAGKQAGPAQTQRTPARAAATVSETLRQLMSRVDQAQQHLREGRRTLQTGEAALAEVQDSLGRMEELARQSAGDGALDRDALQAELERLRGEISRIAREGVRAGLFQDGDGLDGLDALVDAVMDGLSAPQDSGQSLPAWLLASMADSAPGKAALLSALGVDGTATGPELLAALGRLPLEGGGAAGYLASLYLGAVISGGAPSGAVDPAQAEAGLRQLLETVAEGISPDRAIELLTGGTFTSFEDFQAQFSAGTAPGLQPFLTDLLLSGSVDAAASMPALLTGDGGELELLMNLLDALGGSGDGLLALLDGLGAGAQENGPPPLETLELGTVQVSGQDLSGAAFDADGNTLTASGTQDLLLRGLEQEAPALQLTGSGTVTLQQVSAPAMAALSPQAQVLTVGENQLDQLQLGQDTVLTLGGTGWLRIGALRGEAGSVLRLLGGAVAVDEVHDQPQAVPIVVGGPVSLLAPAGVAVTDPQGRSLESFDIVWKLLLPEWSAVTGLSVDGKQGRLALPDDHPDPLRLWLLKGNTSQSFPAHTIVLRGRDQSGHPRLRYVYVRWEQREGRFQELSMYPNPFTVTGGEAEVDWRYEEDSQTLRILSNQVTAVSGGAGTDANQQPFSGRLALADGIGGVELTLDGVTCRVSAGRAFSLGRKNDVTLLLRRGTENIFESGPNCAGISLGEGTSLRVDQAKGGRSEPDGTLTATGGSGGAGIGRDRGEAGLCGSIHICGGAVSATGAGGGAGIGGALGAPAGDIRIQGGAVTARADCCAAAIGAGIQGACGDIVITGSARVVNAQGGGPDGDIGGCLFGNCGKVQVSAGTNLGGAKLWTQKGLSLPMGDTTVTLPRFRVSAKALHLEELDISTREAAKAAMSVLTSDRRWVTRLQGAYGAMYGQLGQSFGSMYNVHQYFSVVRNTDDASSLVRDIREVLRLSPLAKFLTQRGMEDVSQLLRW